MSNTKQVSYKLTTLYSIAGEGDQEIVLSTHASAFLALWAAHDFLNPLTGTPVDVDLYMDDVLVSPERVRAALQSVLRGDYGRRTPAATEAALRPLLRGEEVAR